MCEPTTVLVAEGCHEAHIPNSVLAACSPVFCERFAISEPSDENRCVEDGVSPLEVDSFIGLCTLFTPHPTMPSLLSQYSARYGSSAARLEVQRLAAALTLVHKYDCCGVRKVISHLAAKHFPKCSFIVPKRLSADGSEDEDALAPVLPISSWISQEHLEYMMRAQELFPDDETLLNPTCIAVLGHALSLGGVQWSECTRYANGYHFNHRAIEIVDSVEPVVVHVEPLNKKKKEEGDRASTTTSLPGEQLRAYRTTFDPPSGSMHVFMTPLILERDRLTAPTLMRIVPTLHPKHHVRITSDLLERGCEEMPPVEEEGEKVVEGGVSAMRVSI